MVDENYIPFRDEWKKSVKRINKDRLIDDYTFKDESQ